MRVRSRVAVVAAAAILGLPGAAYAADPPIGPVTAQTVAAAQADATAAANASTAAAQAAALAQVTLNNAIGGSGVTKTYRVIGDIRFRGRATAAICGWPRASPR